MRGDKASNVRIAPLKLLWRLEGVVTSLVHIMRVIGLPLAGLATPAAAVVAVLIFTGMIPGDWSGGATPQPTTAPQPTAAPQADPVGAPTAVPEAMLEPEAMLVPNNSPRISPACRGPKTEE